MFREKEKKNINKIDIAMTRSGADLYVYFPAHIKNRFSTVNFYINDGKFYFEFHYGYGLKLQTVHNSNQKTCYVKFTKKHTGFDNHGMVSKKVTIKDVPVLTRGSDDLIFYDVLCVEEPKFEYTRTKTVRKGSKVPKKIKAKAVPIGDTTNNPYELPQASAREIYQAAASEALEEDIMLQLINKSQTSDDVDLRQMAKNFKQALDAQGARLEIDENNNFKIIMEI